ncbi:MAG: helix-turn-helix domain-containing protein [Acidobacteriia bacterium]|nr:helix-turn-helix domain-containing protein [Terriglobia bacterium]
MAVRKTKARGRVKARPRASAKAAYARAQTPARARAARAKNPNPNQQPKDMAPRQPTVRDMQWISVNDMAEALGCHRETVLRYIHTGIIDATRPDTEGGRAPWKISREFALRFIAGVAGHKQAPMARPKAKRQKGTESPEVLPGQLPLYSED